jgi:signal transduction histidine kinase
MVAGGTGWPATNGGPIDAMGFSTHTRRMAKKTAAKATAVVPVIARDATERQRAETKLRRNETQLRAILEATFDGILAVDNDGERVIAANRRFGELWKIPQALVDAGDNRVLLDFVRDQLCEPDAFLKKAMPISGTNQLGWEILTFKDGRIFEHHGFPILLDGAVIGRVSSFRDITERKRSEAELNKHRDHLEELVKDRTAELRQAHAETEAAYRKLIELEKLRDDLVHMVVHDMRSPLAGLGMFLELLSPEEVNEPDFAESLHLMRETSRALSDMVTSLLDISRLEAGQMPLHCETCDLIQLTSAAQQRLSGLTQGRRVSIHPTNSPVPAHCDPVVTERIFQNLLGNALKFTPREGMIRINLALEEQWGRFSVSDTGPGIPVEYHEKVFQKFGQAEIREARKVPSSGLGLAFCKLAVEAQGGNILLESEPGRGTTFHVRLPRQRPGTPVGNAA